MIDQQSLTWQEVKGLCDAEIAICLARIEARNCDYNETEFQRGQLVALRKILALTFTPKPPSGAPPVKGLYD
jgi:hypothetical protein